MSTPHLRVERTLLRERCDGGLLAAIDEVGRGALAGPVSVGVVLIDLDTRSAPQGVRDSKLLTPSAREALVPRIRRWAIASAVGHATNDDIDAIGIIAALRLAARRALEELEGEGHHAAHVLLDGSHDWLTPPVATLFDADDWTPPGVTTRVKADMSCAAVAAASVLAKVERDAVMVKADTAYPGYGWAANKGYAAADHRQALLERGASDFHRRSWNLMAADEDGAVDPQSAIAP